MSSGEAAMMDPVFVFVVEKRRIKNLEKRKAYTRLCKKVGQR